MGLPEINNIFAVFCRLLISTLSWMIWGWLMLQWLTAMVRLSSQQIKAATETIFQSLFYVHLLLKTVSLKKISCTFHIKSVLIPFSRGLQKRLYHVHSMKSPFVFRSWTIVLNFKSFWSTQFWKLWENSAISTHSCISLLIAVSFIKECWVSF